MIVGFQTPVDEASYALMANASAASDAMFVATYGLPFLPLVLRLLVGVRYSGYMWQPLPDAARDEANHRMVIVGLAGFAFTALLGLLALVGKLEERRLAIWLVLLSVLFLLAALTTQGVKALRWHDQAGDGLLEGATIGLVGSVIAFVLKADELGKPFQIASLVIAVLVCGGELFLKLWLTVDHFKGMERRDGLAPPR